MLNANYLAALVADEYPLAFPDGRPMHEFVVDGEAAHGATGVRAMDVAKRMIDLGFHPSTVYFPLVVEEAMMVEPTETESKETLDAFAAALHQVAEEAAHRPGPAARRAGHDAGAPPGRGAGRPPPQAAMGCGRPARLTSGDGGHPRAAPIAASTTS